MKKSLILLPFLLFVSCSGEKSSDGEEEKYPRSHADEVKKIWEVPKGKASAAKRLVEDKDREVQRQLEMLDR